MLPLTAVGIPFSNPGSGMPKNGLVAEHRMYARNLLKWSEDFSNAAWTKNNGATARASGTNSPSGAPLFFLNEGSLTASHNIAMGATFEAGKTYVLSFEVKKNVRRYCEVVIATKTGRYFDLEVGTVLAVDTQQNAGLITPLGNGVYRCSLVWTSDTTGTLNCQVLPSASGVSGSYTGDNSDAIYATAAQLSFGTTPLDYERTTDLQTLWDSKLTPTDVQNVVVNGLPNNATGWVHYLTYSTETFVDGWIRSTKSASKPYFGRNDGFGIPVNHKLYTRYTIRGNKSGRCDIILFKTMGVDNIGSKVLSITANGLTDSAIITNTDVCNGFVFHGVDFTADGDYVEVQKVSIIDLTALGLDHWTIAMCDAYFSPWFDGTKTIALPKGSGVAGSADGSDSNDPLPTAEGYRYTTDDYHRIPLPFDANGDWTVYLAVKRDGTPTGTETFFAIGSSSSDNPFLSIAKYTGTSLLRLGIKNDAAVYKETTLTLQSGYRLIVVKRSGNSLLLKDLLAGTSATIDLTGFTNLTVNKASLGALLRTTNVDYLNGDIALYAPYALATTDATDRRMLRYVKRLMRMRGVTM